MFGLLSLGFTLSLDNFRSSLVLGGLKPTFAQSVKTSAIFGLWDGVAPLVGIVVGSLISEKVSGTADTIAIIGLGTYGLFLIGRSLTSPERADPDLRWARFGLPIPLSLDNIAGGAALGLAGYSPWLAPVLFAVITFSVSLAGHQIGRTLASVVDFIPRINTDLLTGIGFAALAVLAVLGVHLPLSDE